MTFTLLKVQTFLTRRRVYQIKKEKEEQSREHSNNLIRFSTKCLLEIHKSSTDKANQMQNVKPMKENLNNTHIIPQDSTFR